MGERYLHSGARDRPTAPSACEHRAAERLGPPTGPRGRPPFDRAPRAVALRSGPEGGPDLDGFPNPARPSEGATGGASTFASRRSAMDPNDAAGPAEAAMSDQLRSMPIIDAVMKAAKFPAIMARSAKFARSLRRSGASGPRPPSWMAIEAKFANPHRA